MEKRRGEAMHHLVALFGEGERGPLHTPILLHSLEELLGQVGNPPEGSRGVFFAIQALLSQKSLLFFRVEEEGFSKEDYFIGFHLLLERKEKILGIGLPGVGDEEIFAATKILCQRHRCLLLTTEQDFYDYVTSF